MEGEPMKTFECPACGKGRVAPRGTRRSSLALLPCRAEGRSVSPANRVHQAVQRQHEDSAAAGGNDRELHVPGRLVRPLEVGFRDRVAEPSRIDVVDDKALAELAC